MHSIRVKKLSIILTLDLSKAYTMTSWLYPRLLLIHIGFNLSIVNLIMDYASSIYVVIINGATSLFLGPLEDLAGMPSISISIFIGYKRPQ